MGVRSDRSGSVVETTASKVPKTGTQVITMTRTKVRSLSLRDTLESLRSFVVRARTATGQRYAKRMNGPKNFRWTGYFQRSAI
jgi:hypothetical protein